MLTSLDRETAVGRLIEAELSRTPILQLSKQFPSIEIADSYAISVEVARRKISDGAKVIGYKIGLTSKASQLSSQIDEPIFGRVFDTGMVADGAKVQRAGYCAPRVEPELAFVLSHPLQGPGVGLMDVLRATEYVFAAMEIVDARVRGPRKIADTIADNTSAAGIVLGGHPVKPTDVNLRWAGAILYRNAEIEGSGLAAGVLGHPANGIAWLANKLWAFGAILQPGNIIMSGSLAPSIPAEKGDTFHADFGALGGLAIEFV